MYGITNDYFDSFTAIFGPKECQLNGKRYPLGHFAVEALEMDRCLLRDLEKTVADFKPELEVFLAARTASSAAVAQQKLDAVWTVLAQLPAYKILLRTPMVRMVCFTPCENIQTARMIPSPKGRTFTVR